MKLLIDSQVLIWLTYESDRIGPAACRTIDEAEDVYVSSVSLWELAIKHAKDKLAYSPTELLNSSVALGLERLSLKDEHILRLQTIIMPHRDPFDRMLLAQSETEGCILLTSDQHLLSTKYQTLAVSE
jgi:PIN domain nuclease of toxin-antitoxin system